MIEIVRAIVVLLACFTPMVTWAEDVRIKYVPTRRMEHIDVYHGIKVPDPYRWLEADARESKEVAQWVDAQNKVTFGYLMSIPEREAIRKRLTELWNYEKYGTPFKRGGRYYYFKNDGLQNQDVLYRMDALNDEPRVLIDPNTWSKDGTVSLAGTSFSEDGKHMAYGIAEAGSDWRTWRVMVIETGKVLDDQLKWVKFSGTSWTKDGKGFFYSRFDEPQPTTQFQDLNLNQRVHYHRVGTPQSQDTLVYRREDHPKWSFDAKVTEDGRYLIISVWKGTDEKCRVLYKDLTEPYCLPIDLIDNFENEYTFVGNDGSNFYFKTDLDASRGRLIVIDIRSTQRKNWKQVIPETKETLIDVSFVANMFVARYLKDVQSQIKIHTMDGHFVREVQLPGVSTASGFRGRSKDTETFYSIASFATPPSVYRYDMITGESTRIHCDKVKFNARDYEVNQTFYSSKDGTRVPMFIAHKRGLRWDGSHPTLLYGYGGFNISLTPQFSIGWLLWMEMGGVFAMANLRGGGEYGEDWHRAGTKLNKQNVFDDFIAAAEWLIDQGYTHPKKLAIHGGSNGGLLVGAVMTQRPELFGACLPAVGVMDMLRFHKFTAGRFWVDDYGSADSPEEFKALLAYSPYHNLKLQTTYPPTLVTTADTDDRVVPGHSFKFAAALQHAQSGPAPTLIRIETRAGHGAGKPTIKIIEEVADKWAFLVKNLEIKLPK